ncbi:aspartate racemase, partial [Robbsia andropogonis]
HWISEMRAHSAAPMLHIAEACVAEVPADARQVAVLATGGTMMSGFYQHSLRERGITPIEPNQAVQQHVSDCIREVKAGNIPASAEALSPAIRMLAEQGAQAVIMGCTEIPLAARPLSSFAARLGVPLIDSTLALARATVAFAHDRGWLLAPAA